jgi:multisubunit Na+/H+ antiporter MnhB subunit
MMMAFDVLLMLSLLVLAWKVLSSTDLFRAVVLFVAFGFLVALAWLRLKAPDVALAEAAIGSGLTGALFLSALKRGRPESRNDLNLPLALWQRMALGGCLFAAACLLGVVVWRLFLAPSGLSSSVSDTLPASGVLNPVTAVLLNFRAYDTLLELAVLLAALVAVWSLSSSSHKDDIGAVLPLQQALVHVLVPLMIVVAGTLLWIGSFAPGGAFQAGAMLGGAGVLLALSKPHFSNIFQTIGARSLICAGLFVFMAVGIGVAFEGRVFLQYPLWWAGALILIIEVAAAISIGAILTGLFARD